MGNADSTERDEPGRRILAAFPGRIDAVLADACPDLSRSRIQRLIASGYVLLNGEPARKSDAVAIADEIDLAVPAIPHAAPVNDFDLPVLYEDEALIAVDKPAGLPVHGAPGDTSASVAGWMLERLGELASRFDAEHPGIVHRLDKQTSGVLLLAKTPTAQAAISAAFQDRMVEKTYIAVTDGVPSRRRAIVDAPIARHPGDRTRMAVARSGRESRTGYEVLAEDHGHAFLVVHPETGRTHQIRVHLAAIGCPVTFDRVYGTAGEGRQLLHAWRIHIPHPEGGTLEVTAPLAPDFAAFTRSTVLEPLASEYMEAIPPLRELASK